MLMIHYVIKEEIDYGIDGQSLVTGLAQSFISYCDRFGNLQF